MHVFVTGASGHIASAVIPELVSAGHVVTGLVRSDRSAAAIESLGAHARRGDLDDLGGLGDAARAADGVIHLAFKHDEMRAGGLAAAAAADLRTIETMGAAMAGTGKPLVGTGATLGLVLAGFRGWLTESDTWPGGPRIETENTVIALADHGVRSSVVRLPPVVHGDGRYGFVSGLTAIARATRVSGYAGNGENRWPTAHKRDVALLYRAALESAQPGSRLHATAEDGIAVHDIAAAIGHRLGLPITSIPASDVEQHFQYLSGFIGLDNPVSSKATRDSLRWSPEQPGLLAELDADTALVAQPAPTSTR